MAQDSDYRRLPGRTVGLFRSSLWLGSDHLLSVINRGYTEDYKRFYYRDIRAVLLRKTSTYSVLNVVFGSFFGVCILIQLLAWLLWKWEMSGQIAWGFLTGIWAIFFLSNLVRGATCSANLYTAVHSEPLSSLRRLRSARQAMALLRARIEAVQGTLTRDQALAGAGILQATSPAPPAESRIFPSREEPIVEYSGNFHWSLYSLLLFNALLNVVLCYYRSAMLNVANVFLYLAMGVCMIGALIRQRNSRMGKGLRKTAWTSAIYIWFVSVLSSFIAVYVLFQGGVKPGQYGYWDLMKSVMETVPAEHLPLLIIQLFSSACSLALGLAGMVLLMRYRRGIH